MQAKEAQVIDSPMRRGSFESLIAVDIPKSSSQFSYKPTCLGDLEAQISVERTKLLLKEQQVNPRRNLLLANQDYICYASGKELKILPKNQAIKVKPIRRGNFIIDVASDSFSVTSSFLFLDSSGKDNIICACRLHKFKKEESRVLCKVEEIASTQKNHNRVVVHPSDHNSSVAASFNETSLSFWFREHPPIKKYTECEVKIDNKLVDIRIHTRRAFLQKQSNAFAYLVYEDSKIEFVELEKQEDQYVINSVFRFHSHFINGKVLDFSSTVKNAVLHDFLIASSQDGKKFKIWDTSDSYLNQQEITVHCLDIQADELNAVDFHFTDSMRMVVLASRKGPTARCIQLAVTHNQYGEDPAPIRFQVVVEHHFRLSSDLLYIKPRKYRSSQNFELICYESLSIVRLKLENPKRLAKTLDLKQPHREEQKSMVEENPIQLIDEEFDLDDASVELLEKVLTKQEEINQRLEAVEEKMQKIQCVPELSHKLDINTSFLEDKMARRCVSMMRDKTFLVQIEEEFIRNSKSLLLKGAEPEINARIHEFISKFEWLNQQLASQPKSSKDFISQRYSRLINRLIAQVGREIRSAKATQ